MNMDSIGVLNLFLLFLFCSITSAIAIRVATHLVGIFRIVDRPGDGHKLHEANTPFVGGIGLLTVLLFTLLVFDPVGTETSSKWIVLGICATILFVTGFIDDTIRLSYKFRFLVQGGVALVMVMNGDMVVHSLGHLFSGEFLQLPHWIAAAFTVIALIGGINAINMIDGMDGLSGSVSLASLALMGVVAFQAGDQDNLLLICALSGGLSGFLYYNLRYASKRSARVFLGDNGSMLVGLVLCWLLIDLSQGPTPAMTPITAIWLFAIPLLDTVSVMLRRMFLGKSPFMPDHLHLHHLFLKSGFFVTEIIALIVILHVFFGVIGLLGLYFSVDENWMLFGFILMFLSYLYLTLHPWRFISMVRFLRILLRTRLGRAPAASDGVFFGFFTANETEKMARIVNEELGSNSNFSIRVFEQLSVRRDFGKHFAITLNIWLTKDDYLSEDKLNQRISLLQLSLEEKQGILLRRLRARNRDSDLRVYSNGSPFGESRVVDRRSLGPQALAFEVTMLGKNNNPFRTQPTNDSNSYIEKGKYSHTL